MHVWFNVPLDTSYVISDIIIPGSHLAATSKIKHNYNEWLHKQHLAATSKIKHNYNEWLHKQPKQKSMKTTNIHKTKPNETKVWFTSPKCRPARKQIGNILQLPGPARSSSDIAW